MPGKGGAAGRRKRPPRPRRFRHARPDELRAAALGVLRRSRGAYPSQGQLLRAVRGLLRRDDPLAVVGGPRLRRLLLDAPGVRVGIEFAERPGTASSTTCPICGGAVRPIGNRTLDGETVTLGYRCPACGYWTHRRRRVPVRYTFRAVPGAPRGRDASGRGALRSSA